MVVLDSSFLIAYHNRRDVHHAAAASVMDRLTGGAWGPALLLEYVFLEVLTVLLARRGLDAATKVGTLLLHARDVEFVPCSDIFLAALETFRMQRTGALSFTDAAIVTVARAMAGGVVATFDSDFRGVDGITAIPA